MPDMHRTVGDEAISPCVKRRAELRRARRGLGDVSIQTEAKVGSADRDRRAFGMLRRCDVAILAEIGTINPVVDAKPRIRDAILSIHCGKSRVQDFSDVGFAVPVCIFHEQNIWCAGNNKTAFPGHQAAHFQNVVGKDCGAVNFAVAIGILQQPDARTGRFSRRRIRRIVEHFGDIDSAIFIKDHFDRTHHPRLTYEQLDVEIIIEMKAFQLGLWG